MLSAEQTRVELIAAIRSYIEAGSSLDELRAAAESIAERWRSAASEDLPPVTDSEDALWSVLWDVITGCHEAISREGLRQQLRYLAGDAALPPGTRGTRP